MEKGGEAEIVCTTTMKVISFEVKRVTVTPSVTASCDTNLSDANVTHRCSLIFTSGVLKEVVCGRGPKIFGVLL